MRPLDPRLFRHARAARGYLIVTVALGVMYFFNRYTTTHHHS
jgi:hypothetical protein